MKEELEKREYEFTKDIEWDTTGDSEEKFWIPVRRFVAEEKDDNGKVVQKEEIKNAGKIQCSLRVYPKDQSEKAA